MIITFIVVVIIRTYKTNYIDRIKNNMTTTIGKRVICSKPINGMLKCVGDFWKKDP